MRTFIEHAIERAGLGGVLAARRRGDAVVEIPASIDLLLLGALADAVRMEEIGDVVRVHPTPEPNVQWVTGSDLELLRNVARARATGPRGARIGVDWGAAGLELAQVALGFGASDLTGPITKKSGLVILETDKKKVKGQGMVAAATLKRREIAALIRNAGRVCELTDEPGTMIQSQETTYA